MAHWSDNDLSGSEREIIRKAKPNVVVHAGVATNAYPQGPTFHWRDGWMFARGEGMNVHVWKNSHNGPPEVSLCIPRAEWESIVGFLSYPTAPATPRGEALNDDPEKAAAHPADTGPINGG
jgi:hypothetical protein